MSETKTCFVISPIGEPDTEIRKRSDVVLKHVIAPAVNECGFEPIRADQISEPGIITSQIIQHIVSDPLVIADLTGRNPNVFYELALRHAIRKPLVQIITKGEQIPFDVASTRIIMLDHRDLDSVEEAKNEIIKQIKVIISDPSKVDTPISMSLDLQSLRRSGEPEQRSLADMIEAISSIHVEISNIKKDLTSRLKARSEAYDEMRHASEQLLSLLSMAGRQVERMRLEYRYSVEAGGKELNEDQIQMLKGFNESSEYLYHAFDVSQRVRILIERVDR
jgi:hypothetical protein